MKPYQCNCDCECSKETNEEFVDRDTQCDDCDNGIHWDNIRKKYVNYEESETD